MKLLINVVLMTDNALLAIPDDIFCSCLKLVSCKLKTKFFYIVSSIICKIVSTST